MKDAHVNHAVISARFVIAIAILIAHTQYDTDPQGCGSLARREGFVALLSKGKVMPALGKMLSAKR